MEDEICPYATFHLLGFREEMDPGKFAHAHAGTLAHAHGHAHAHSRSGSQSMPRANSRYARKNSQGGQSAIYSAAPEYDDPATCAEEDQYVSPLSLALRSLSRTPTLSATYDTRHVIVDQ